MFFMKRIIYSLYRLGGGETMSNYSVTGPCVVVYSDWAGMPAYEVLEEGEEWYEGAMEYFMKSFSTIEEALAYMSQ